MIVLDILVRLMLFSGVIYIGYETIKDFMKG